MWKVTVPAVHGTGPDASTGVSPPDPPVAIPPVPPVALPPAPLVAGLPASSMVTDSLPPHAVTAINPNAKETKGK